MAFLLLGAGGAADIHAVDPETVYPSQSQIRTDSEGPKKETPRKTESESLHTGNYVASREPVLTEPGDSQNIHRLKGMLDSLAKASAKLVKTLENDSLLRNSKTVKQVNQTLGGIKMRVNRYQSELSDAVRKED